MRIEVDVRRPRWLRKPATWKGRFAVVGVALLTVAVPVAWASHDFNDVPTSHQFHDQISSIADAGITTGCGGGNYCPDDFVRRDAMAAFMHRGFSRIAMASTGAAPALPSTGTQTTMVAESITVPGSGGTQYVKIDAYGQLNTGVSNGCPCTIGSQIRDVTGGTGGAVNFFDVFNGPGTDVDHTLHNTWAFVAPSGTRTYSLLMWVDSQAAAHNMPMTNAAITVTTYPFNGAANGGPLGNEDAGTASSRESD